MHDKIGESPQTGVWKILKKLFVYSNRLKNLSVSALLIAIAGATLTIIGPNQLSKITNLISDALSGEINLSAISQISIWMLGIYGLSALLTYIEHFIMATVTLDLSKAMRKDLSRKINSVPIHFFHAISYGDVLSRVTNDVGTLQQGLANSLPSMVSAVAQFMGCLAMMLATEWRMALLLLPLQRLALV